MDDFVSFDSRKKKVEQKKIVAINSSIVLTNQSLTIHYYESARIWKNYEILNIGLALCIAV